MLDKTSENVLRYLIDESKGNLTKMITLIPPDTAELNIPFGQVISICQSLEDKKLVNNFACYMHNTGCRLYLTMDGYTYFERSKKDNFRFWIPVIISIVALLRPEITKLINYILSFIKKFG